MQTLAEFKQKNFQLNAQETLLLEYCVAGKTYAISLIRPVEAIETGENANVIRAAFIRWLALGGDN